MKKFLLLFLTAFFAEKIFALPDLSFSGSVNVNTTSVHIGITVNITFNVQNTGTAASNSSTAIYISPTTSITSSSTLVRIISMEALAASTSSNGIQCSFPIPYNAVTSSGTYYVIVKLNQDNSVIESNYTNNTANASLYIDANAWAAQNIPYPIIFIHGYMSDNTTWNDLTDSLRNNFGWSYGGNMDFCLNYDTSLATSNMATDYHDFTGSSGHLLNPNPCDFYTVNFANNPSGSGTYNNSYQSNQAAIAKQGMAVQDAIAHVLAVTGKDKVILVCHSMGGLAAREYLQNPNLKQSSDNLKHVAKLLTIGTPHGGTDIVASNLGVVYSTGYDGRSEAIRDLRTGYYYSYYWPFGALNPDVDAPGAYLFSGVEDLGYMRDQFASTFYNADVNCDGVVTGQPISGINNRSLPNDINYSCIIGNGCALPIFGDGVVSEYSANLNNFLSVNAQTFTLPMTSGTVWHIELTKQFAGIVQGMDEPNDNSNSHAYSISSGQLYYGLISYESVGSSPRDYDNYKINITSSGNLNIQVYNITTPLFSIDIRNSSNSSVYSIASNGKSYINANIAVTSGNYYVVLSGIPTANSFYNPYAFKCTFSATTTFCSGTTNLTAPSGTFTDGSGSSNYSNNSDCRWKIKPSGATKIILNFSSFSVSNPGDTVYVYNGGTITSPLLGKFTGSTLPPNDTSTGGTLLVRFVTDSSNTAPGWAANYTATVGTAYCNGITNLATQSGSFSDGSGTNNYGNNANCSWLISPPGALSVTLSFSAFATEPTNDVVNVYDGSDNNASLLGSYSGSTLPPSLTSSGGAMYVEFLTNDTITAAGWNASYASVIPISNPVSGNPANGIVGYEYWFDTASTRNYVSVTALKTYTLNTNFSTQNLTQGLHSLHVRFVDRNGIWSSVVSDYFQKTHVDTGNYNTVTAYEYWYDANNSRNFVSVTPQQTLNVNQNLPTDTFQQGLHSIHLRFKNGNGQWSSVVSDYFQKTHVDTGNYNLITAYEYWYDTNNALRNFVAVTPQQTLNINQNFPTDTFQQGLHSLHTRFQNGNGQWSSVISDYFQKVYTDSLGNNLISKYEYWYDTASTNRNVVNVLPNIQQLFLDTGFGSQNLTKGFHQLHTRFSSKYGLWSSVTTDSFNKKGLFLIDSVIAPVCANNNIKIRFVKLANYNSGNIFTIQLSDSSGSFAAALSIGTKSAFTTGTDSIICTLPKTLKFSNYYKLRVLCTNVADTSDQSNIFTINSVPLATISYSGNLSFCQGGNTILNAPTGTGLTYQWKNNGTNISGATSSSDTATVSGSYKVVVTNSNGCFDSSNAVVVSVSSYPVSGFTINNSIQILTGNSFVLTDTTSGIGNTRLWNLGDATTDTIRIKTKTYGTANYYIIRLRVTSSAGCSDSTSHNITVLPALPTTSATSLSFSNITTNSMQLTWTNGNGQRRIVLAHASSIVNGNPVNGNNYTANSVFGNGSQIGTGNFVVYKGTGNNITVSGLNILTTYYFSVIEMNGDTTFSSYQNTPYLTNNATTLPVKWLDFTAKLRDKDSVQLNWSTASEINNDHFEIERSIIQNNNWSLIGKVKGNGNTNQISSYQFMDEVSILSNVTNVLYYRIRQVDFDGKFDYSKIAAINLTSFKQDNSFIVYPNPNEGLFTVEFNNSNSHKEIQVYDILGKLIQEISTADTKCIVQLQNVRKGIYLINVKVGGQYYHSKVLIE